MHDDSIAGLQSLDDVEQTDALDIAIALLARLRLLIIAPLAAGMVALGVTYLVAPTFTARTTFVPPQQPQSAAAAALASLSALSGLVNSSTPNVRNPADQYVALMHSDTVFDRIIDQFQLMQVYGEKYRSDARRELGKHVRIAVGKKDGLISLEVDDEDRVRAAAMANQYVEELRRLTGLLALTEAQQRRVFFEQELRQTRDRLTEAQQALQASGFNPGALKAEPKAAAEGYARLRAEATAAEVRLQTLRKALADSAPEVQQQSAMLSALRRQLARVEDADQGAGSADYVGKYREFKYQETLLELLARQYEMARLDESREGAVIQVVDRASPPEKRSWPKRFLTALAATLTMLLILVSYLTAQQYWLRAARRPATAGKLAKLRAVLGR
jgi:capsule polysaccharide export protein KpsE/RkpR